MALILIPEIPTEISVSPRIWAQLIPVWTCCHTFQELNPCTESTTLFCYHQLNFRAFLWLWVNWVSLLTYLRSVNYIWPELELELELELILTKILELEFELNPKNEAGIGINSIFFGMTNGLMAMQKHLKLNVVDMNLIVSMVRMNVQEICIKLAWLPKWMELLININWWM